MMSLHTFPSGLRIEPDEPADHRTQCEKAFRMQCLAVKMPSLRDVPGIDPWDTERLVTEVIPAVTGQTRYSLLFLLSVWDGRFHEYHDTEAFCPVDAISVWDTRHRQVYRQWAENPWRV